jgi:hypothetical protein
MLTRIGRLGLVVLCLCLSWVGGCAPSENEKGFATTPGSAPEGAPTNSEELVTPNPGTAKTP